MSSYYDNFIKRTKPPKEIYETQLQEFVNSSFDNAPTFKTIEEEINSGTLEFNTLDVRINELIDAKTGQRVNDDFKKIIFKDIDYRPIFGTRYRFDDNIWLMTNSSFRETITSNIYLRRCNSTFNIQDKYGNIHKEPIYIGDSITETQIFKDYSIDIARGRIVIFCQLNQYTEDININDRFIAGEDVYKVRNRDKFSRNNTFDNTTSYLLRLQLDYDTIAEYDNVELGVANYKEFNFELIIPSSLNCNVGSEDNIYCQVNLNDVNVSKDYPIVWESSDKTIATIDNLGNYKCLKAGDVELKVRLEEKPEIYSTMLLQIETTPSVIYNGNYIYPNKKYLRIKDIELYQVYEYVNNEKTNTEFDILELTLDNKYYDIVKTSNSFKIQNLKASDIPLEILCINKVTKEEVSISIELGGLF